MLHVLIQSEKDSKEEILKAFKLFDDDDTVRSDKTNIIHKNEVLSSVFLQRVKFLSIT